MTDPNHPRYFSLVVREKLTNGVRLGITSISGLIAHGRGEAFDYLLGERTHPFAKSAVNAAAAFLLLSEKPVLSLNGNAAALSSAYFIKIAKILDCPLEVNLYHHSKKRVETIENFLGEKAGRHLLKSSKYEKMVIPGIASRRKITIREGIGKADCVLVPLEDGDRCRAMTAMGKTVIAIDLNPLSRTARSARVTIIDNIVRCMPQLALKIAEMKKFPRSRLEKISKNYDNRLVIKQALKAMCYHKNNE
ncbi:MAG: hypothetical protein UV73_C0011G0024 [Candidatus Gottesmanbacteria bacterium GW2011_GWA2_43_14]|uniref:4-phosphopantoate--beta-alanine ligase n=1 Tax=Candidatus Gottesmanbacteria bacterium GW2011_GWA2_43_14 TaxID=1618443 RepID=A0A0G1DFH5_9BACT|nr:MAG: hypothetical protein UV73_C0011G0024 [Candidatus Gottesmanbacteria bacterium GW2011_GWA2_43_14]